MMRDDGLDEHLRTTRVMGYDDAKGKNLQSLYMNEEREEDSERAFESNPPTVNTYFEEDSSEMYALLYCMSRTTHVRDMISDENFVDILNNPSIDSSLSVLYKLLSLKFYSSFERKEVDEIQDLIDRYRKSYGKYKDMSQSYVYIQILQDIFVSYTKRYSREDSPCEYDTGVCRLFKIVGFFNPHKPIYHAMLDVNYRLVDVAIYSDSVDVYVLKMYSAVGFFDIKISGVSKMIASHVDDLSDVFFFDPKTGKQVKGGVPVGQMKSFKLVASPLITNLKEEKMARTVKMVFKDNPSVYFYFTCQNGVFDTRVDHYIRSKIKYIMSGIKNFEYIISPPSAMESDSNNNRKVGQSRTKDDNQDTMYSIMRYHHADCESIITVDFELDMTDRSIYVKTRKEIEFYQDISPDDIISDFCVKNKLLSADPSPVISPQMLIVEYPEDFTINQDLLCKDIHSKAIDSDTLVYYKLKSVILKRYPSESMIPIVKIDNKGGTFSWFSAYHNHHLNMINGLDRIKYFIYERTYEHF